MEHLPGARSAKEKEVIDEISSIINDPGTVELLGHSLENKETIRAAIESFKQGEYEPLIRIVEDAYLETLNIPDMADAADSEVDDSGLAEMEEVSHLRSLLSGLEK